MLFLHSSTIVYSWDMQYHQMLCSIQGFVLVETQKGDFGS